MGKIKIENYTADWAHGFTDLKKAYELHLTGNFKVEHVGSTSILGMASRPIIDIDMVVDTKDSLIDLIAQLTYLGYLSITESQEKDVVVLKRCIKEVPLLNEHHSKWVEHHLNVCLENSLYHKAHLSFVNYMMTHENEIEVFGDLKTALSHKHSKDLNMYQNEKSLYIMDVLKSEGYSELDIEKLKNYPYT